MTITQVYERYEIMPSLQLHMLRVAGVAQIVADNCSKPVDRDAIISACLLHDMGNIAKFDLLRFPDFIEPEGLEFWQNAKDEFVQKYGNNPHQATVAIARELDMSERVMELIDAISFNQEKKNFETDDFSKKIAAYSDMRVAPWGVVSLEERLADALVRYREPGKKDTFHFVMRAFLRKIELQLIEVCEVDPREITEKQVVALFAELKEWQVLSDN